MKRIASAASAVALLGGSALVVGGLAGAGPAAAASCVPAGSTGFTAAMVATTGQSITGTVDATGCNLGIYIPPGATGVTVTAATVSNATDHAVLAEDTSNVTVTGSTFTNNGTDPNPDVAGDDAVFFAGVTNGSITNNTFNNDYAGGTRVADYGAVDGAAPNPGPATQVPSTNVTVSGNTYTNIYGGCAALVAVYNAGTGASGVTFTGNTITGNVGQFGPHGPMVGQIVIADDAVGATISGVTLTGNTITGS